MDIQAVLDSIFSRISGTCFEVRYWNGSHVKYGEGAPSFSLSLPSAKKCRHILGNVGDRAAEAYVSGELDIGGDVQRCAQLLYLIDLEGLPLSIVERIRLAYLYFSQRNTLSRAPSNVVHHYDAGNDFYSLWLGREMVYSCAYFADSNRENDLDRAQESKLHRICTKLQLRRGDRLLDIGCGWGGLLLYAARRFGVEGLGVTISPSQHAYAVARAQQEGLASQVKFEVLDYRELKSRGTFNKVVSVGMVEHVGREYIPLYASQIAAVLQNGGIGVVQSIGRRASARMNPWISRRIFPGMYVPTLADLASAFGESGFNISDVEILRRHYALTIDQWLKRFDENVQRVEARYGMSFVRAWRLYLHAAAAALRYGDLTLYQIQLTKGQGDNLPLTREYMDIEPSSLDTYVRILHERA